MSKKTQEPPIKKNAFVHKLYTMLNDPKLSHLIWWTNNTPENNTFALYPGKEFANALTGYFKHGNVASFVRQLHMYGFHKVSEPNQSPAANYDKDSAPVWEFKHSSGKFKKDDESSLIYIKRRSSSNSSRNCYSSEHTTTTLPNPHNEYFFGATSTPSPSSYDPYYQPYVQYYPPGQVMYQYPYVPYQYGEGQVPPPPPPQTQHGQIIQPGQHVQPGQHIHPVQHMVPPHLAGAPQPPPGPPQGPVQGPASGPPPAHQPHQGAPAPLHPHQLAQLPPYTPIPHPSTNIPRSDSDYYEHRHSDPRGDSRDPRLADPRDRNGRLSDPRDSSARETRDSTNTTHTAHAKNTHTTTTNTPPTVQHYTPNLQFRKIWNKPDEEPRPRNPSLLFDPLATGPPRPASAAVPSSLSVPFTRSPAHSPVPEPPTSPKRDLSVKLPPPSTIHRASSASLPNPQSPEPGSPVPLKASIPHSLRSNTPTSSIGLRSVFEAASSAASIPGSPSAPKKPSLVPINTSFHERLRPSLIELHLGTANVPPPSAKPANGSVGSTAKPQNDSIGSQSSHNSVFSNKSSVSSISSIKRTSSFGSISHHPAIIEHKTSFSISPHDPIPPTSNPIAEIAQPQATRWGSESTAPTSQPFFSGHQFQSPRSSSPIGFSSRNRLIRSLTPPPNAGSKSVSKFPSLNSPIPRSSTSLPAFNHPQRSLTNSPLSKLTIEDKKINKKVSVTSLLDDSEAKKAYPVITATIKETVTEDVDPKDPKSTEITTKDELLSTQSIDDNDTESKRRRIS